MTCRCRRSTAAGTRPIVLVVRVRLSRESAGCGAASAWRSSGTTYRHVASRVVSTASRRRRFRVILHRRPERPNLPTARRRSALSPSARALRPSSRDWSVDAIQERRVRGFSFSSSAAASASPEALRMAARRSPGAGDVRRDVPTRCHAQPHWASERCRPRWRATLVIRGGQQTLRSPASAVGGDSGCRARVRPITARLSHAGMLMRALPRSMALVLPPCACHIRAHTARRTGVRSSHTCTPAARQTPQIRPDSAPSAGHGPC